MSEGTIPILKRDGFGVEGRTVMVKANSFEVKKISKYDEFLKYVVEIKPIHAGKNIETEVKRERSDYGKNIRRRVIKELGLKREELFQDVIIAYDGGSTLYTTGRLGFDKNTEAKPVFKVEINLHDYLDIDGNPTRYSVLINRTDNIITLTKLESYINGEEFEWDFFSDDAFDVLNALIHQTGAKNYTQSGKSSIYDKGNKIKLNGGIELWSGWFSTVRPGQGSLFINVNPTFTTFYQNLRLDHFLNQYLYYYNPKKYQYLPNQFDYDRDKSALRKINEILKGVIVRPLHLKAKAEMRIKSILPINKIARFRYKQNANSEAVLLEKYYNNQRREKPKLFAEMMSDENTSIAWPVEFCEIIEGQRYSNNKLLGKQRAEIISVTKRKPSINEKETVKGAHKILQLQNDPTGIGMEVSPDLVKVESRVLVPTDVRYAGKVARPVNGQWNLRNFKFIESGESLDDWGVVLFDQYLNKKDVEAFIKNLIDQCVEQGMSAKKRMPHLQIAQFVAGNTDKVIKSAFERAKNALKRLPQMILFIIPGDKSPINTELYETIKRVMDIEIGCLSQCVSSDSSRKFRDPQFCANLAMKMNLKLGGVNSILPENKLLLPSGENVLFLGADVTHPKDKTGRSVCAVVGSLDNRAARFVTKYQDQERSGLEEILRIDVMIKEILKDYCNHQKKSLPPPCIIMYRDGVSESQFERVLKWELPKIQDACAEFRTGYKPKIIFAIVGKRHHTRLFPENPKNINKEADRNGNCLVGTVVDKKITHPTLNDFYLQSHYANQGTARPSHYTILHDDVKLTPDQFQGLSNTLCYNFQRTTSSVSIPAPTYYAHLTCARAKMYLDKNNKLPEIHKNIKKYPMYFM